MDPVPRMLVLTDRRQAAAAGRDVVDTAAAAVAAGAPAVVLRDKDLEPDARRRLADRLAQVCAAADARLLVAGDADLARDVAAAGVHLAAADPPVAAAVGLVGRSCHDTAEVHAARREGVDYVTASPVAATASKPGYGPALGPDGLARLVTAADGMSVLALGGVTPDDVATWRRAGAYGIAVMGAVMTAANPAAVVAELLARLGDAPR